MSDPVAPTGHLQPTLAGVLRVSGALAIILIGLGTLLDMVSPTPPGADGFIGQLIGGGAGSIVSAGLLILVLTPLATLAASVVAFARQRERRYVIIAGAALGLLAASLAAGAAIGLGIGA